MNEEKITIDYKEWQEIMRDYDYQTKQANEYLLEAQKYACDVYVDVLERINQELQQQNQKYKEVIDKSIKCIDYNNRYRNGADIYQFVDIKGEILEPLKDILEQNEENSNIYLKEFNDWLKEVE